MNSDSNFEPEPEPSECQAIATTVRAFAQRYQKDNLALLTLLRRLEELHREIRDGVFQSSLPDHRQYKSKVRSQKSKVKNPISKLTLLESGSLVSRCQQSRNKCF